MKLLFTLLFCVTLIGGLIPLVLTCFQMHKLKNTRNPKTIYPFAEILRSLNHMSIAEWILFLLSLVFLVLRFCFCEESSSLYLELGIYLFLLLIGYVIGYTIGYFVYTRNINPLFQSIYTDEMKLLTESHDRRFKYGLYLRNIFYGIISLSVTEFFLLLTSIVLFFVTI